jgi:superfamily II DNA or RNA helicase/HKD family nuclease
VTKLHPGLYERLVTTELDEALRSIDPGLLERGPLDPADAHEILARHVGAVARRALLSVSGDDQEAVVKQIELANHITEAIVSLASDAATAADLVAASRDVLLALTERIGPGASRHPRRPEVPLSVSALLVNGREQPRIGTEIQRELESADAVDLLCAFVKWHGLRILEPYLESFARQGELRVITTTYIGATERRAVDRLAELGAQVKVSYETHMTRLHAKAWLFRRDTGFSTAYVGSSNLSKTALIDGLEWNVRLSAVEQPHLLEAFKATFDEYWEDPAFESYDPNSVEDRERLDQALAAERGGPADLPIEITSLQVCPWGYQREILEELEAERDVHGHTRNLVVMATGTGKTVVAALDYERLRQAGAVDTLLFVAHRDEILGQALSTFRHVIREGSFGERMVGGERPTEWRHVFASVQSLARIDLEKDLDPSHFDMVIVDEFHHAMAPTYERFLRHMTPRQLLGLTATPERADGTDVRVWFDGRTAVELRLWEALERGLLAPFQYFGLHDDTDLTSVRWKRGSGYDVGELTNVYTGHDARVRIVLQALLDKVTDPGNMRALGFCVSIAHAEFMARRFNEAGIPSRAVTSTTPQDERRASLVALRKKELNVVFTVDLFNEGVDVPEIDTVLFLRPTESATVFLQQLGRGLRLAADKPCLTALDFIGQQHADFRFDLRYRALTGSTRRQVERNIDRGFPTLPAGCHIELDRVASEIVLQNVRSSLRINWRGLVSELRQLGDLSLASFLDEAGLEVDDVYRRRRGGWAGLRRDAGLDAREPGPDDARLAGAIGRMLHIDDLERMNFIGSALGQASAPNVPSLSTREGRLMAMLHFSLWGANEDLNVIADGLARLWANPSRREEILELLDVLRAEIRRVTHPVDPVGRVPLQVHARYSRDEALAAFGVDKPGTMRQGVRWVAEEGADVFFITLRKTEKHYSPTTMYADRAITPALFQWESQSTTSEPSATGQRYVDHRERGSSVHLFTRESREGDGDLGAPPYMYCGRANYVSHTGDRPMRILWRLEVDLPADMFHAAKVASG